MAFRLDPAKGPLRQVRRLLVGECRQALQALAATESPAADQVHELRRCGKRSRALLRLVRPGLSKRVFRRENRAWRDLARRFSAARDRTVVRACLLQLARRYADRLPAHIQAQATAVAQRDGGRAEAMDAPSRQEAAATLATLRQRLADLPLRGGWKRLLTGFARSEAAFCAAGLAAGRHPGAAAARHQWRKRAKDLHYQAHLLARAWPGLLEPLASDSGRLGDLLGQERDLALACRWLDGHLGQEGALALRRCARDWRRHLRARCARLMRERLLPPPARRKELRARLPA